MATVFTELLYVKAERYKEGQNAKLVGWHRNSQPGGWWQQTGCVGAIFQCAAFALHAGYYFSVRQAFVVITRFKATSMHWLWLICFVYGGIFFFSQTSQAPVGGDSSAPKQLPVDGKQGC